MLDCSSQNEAPRWLSPVGLRAISVNHLLKYEKDSEPLIFEPITDYLESSLCIRRLRCLITKAA